MQPWKPGNLRGTDIDFHLLHGALMHNVTCCHPSLGQVSGFKATKELWVWVKLFLLMKVVEASAPT